MKKKFDQVYQFKITLEGIRPPIWRRIQVPETYTFWDFHVAIQDVMGWLDYHLHEFEIQKIRSMKNMTKQLSGSVKNLNPSILTRKRLILTTRMSVEELHLSKN